MHTLAQLEEQLLGREGRGSKRWCLSGLRLGSLRLGAGLLLAAASLGAASVASRLLLQLFLTLLVLHLQ